MECKKFERLIPDFVLRKMDVGTLRAFCEHMEECEECKEELIIQFLVTEGMSRLEEGDAFDLQSELRLRLKEVEMKIRHRKRMRCVGIIVGVLLACVIVGIILWFVL
ncbi:MAG: hypothetical protein E7287_10600 [Lachnospiraceae bacterium]|nr:hypothetical protein [Lachnospiraceae bacterium]